MATIFQKTLTIFFVFAATNITSSTIQLTHRYPIIPHPQEIAASKDSFIISPTTKIVLNPNTPELQEVATHLIQLLAIPLGTRLEVSKNCAENSADQSSICFAHTNCILFSLDPKSIEHEEGYQLFITPQKIAIKAKTAQGAFWALQTLRQLMPLSIERQVRRASRKINVPGAVITDAPRFSYRGLHLDVARHLFSVADIKKYIDLMAFYKLNTFHWHLTDDQGWRIEIKKYPRLHEVGGYRAETLIGHSRSVPKKFDGIRYGGYYTQDEVRSLVEYARQRHITVIPEIELPGHSCAAVAAYPELSCKETDDLHNAGQLLAGQPLAGAGTYWGMTDVYCAGKEKTFSFLEDVLTEVMDLFPSTYIHIGGDEVRKTAWKTCKHCQARIVSQGLKDEQELQSYFISRIEKFLNAKGRQIIGWDEIAEGGLAPNATVMSWRGIKAGIEAATQGHKVIMTPQQFLYFDHYQATPEEKQPLAFGGLSTLKKVYDYDPVPSELMGKQAQLIWGVQANVWTEYMKTMKHVEYMAYPRVLALAEIAWTANNKKEYDAFTRRVDEHLKKLRARGVNCAEYK